MGLLLIRTRAGGLPTLRVLELAVYASLTTAVLLNADVQRAIRSMGAARIGIVGLGILCMLATQLVKHANQISYPLYVWSMYSEDNPATRVRRYQAVRQSGAVTGFPFSELAAGRGSPLKQAVDDRARRDDRAQAAGAGVAVDSHGGEWPAMVRTLTALYNRRFPEDPIVEVRLLRCELQKTATRPDQVLQCSLARTLPTL